MPGSILERIKTEPTPLIDQNVATFVWRGRSAPLLVGDFTGWEDGEPVRLVRSGRGLWTHQISLPADAYIEYSFEREGEGLLDPLNPNQISNGMGGSNNYFSMPAYQPTDLARKIADVTHGKVTNHKLPSEYLLTSKARSIHLYQPPVSAPVPLIVVWDGHEYWQRGQLNDIVDNLIAQGRIQPVALAFVDNGGERTRTIEYMCSEATLYFLMTEVLPLATRILNLVDIHDHPGAYGVAGSSMGGLMALYTGLRLGDIFGYVLSQSGAFYWAGLELVLFDLLEQVDPPALKVWMDVGMYDLPGLLVSNQRMRNLLSQKGFALTYHEYNAGHNMPAWRDDIWRGLETLFGVSE